MGARKRIIGENRRNGLERMGVDKKVYNLLSRKMGLIFFEIREAPLLWGI